MATLFQHLSRQGDIACNHKISYLKSFYNLIVSNVKTRSDF